MNPYKDGGPRARLSFVPAYCKRCTAPPSVNDGYIARRPTRTEAPPARTPNATRASHSMHGTFACGNAPRQAAGQPPAPRSPAPADRRVLGPVRAAATRYRRD